MHACMHACVRVYRLYLWFVLPI